MNVFRITLSKWSRSLVASGISARWNSNGMRMLYTAESRSLACLENVVHRSGEGLHAAFSVIVIEIPDQLEINTIELEKLNTGWYKSTRCPKCRQIGDDWLKSLETPVLKVPSAIIKGEWNYMVNPQHPDFEKIKISEVEPFVFDPRIKGA